MPSNSSPKAGREWPVKVLVNNIGTPVSGLMTVLLPLGAEMVDAEGFTKQGVSWTKTIDLDKGGLFEQILYLRMPKLDGAYTINLNFDAQSQFETTANVVASLQLEVLAQQSVTAMLDQAHDVKHSHFLEPHFYLLYADLLLAKSAIENEHWLTAQLLLVGGSNLLLLDSREDVAALRLAIDEQIRIVGHQL